VNSKTSFLGLMLLIGLLSASTAASADRRTSLDQAVSEARDRYPGRVLSATTDRRGGRESHRIRILTDDGKVKRLNMDAESGRFERRGRRR
jgi:uncharacterized membrane protein YkoI